MRRDLAADHDAHARAGRSAASHLDAWPPWSAARWALVYLPFGDELDPFTGLAGPTPRLATTRTEPHTARLTAHELDRAALERHAFGFEQPRREAAPLPLEHVDVVIVPGLCFDRSGGRLGYGRGLYDRLLARLPPTTITVGVAREALVVPALPLEPHDVAVMWLLSEDGLRPTAR